MVRTTSAEGGPMMVHISERMLDEAMGVARALVSSGELIVKMSSPEGRTLLHVSRERDLLQTALAELDVDGTPVYVGLRATSPDNSSTS